MGQQVPIKVVPIEGIDLDTDSTRLKNTRARFIKNMTTDQHRNANADNGTTEGGNAWAITPLEGSQLLDGMPAFPAGKNICIGSYASPETYETYIFVYNNQDNHFIYAYGQFLSPTIVYQGSDLEFSLSPERYISEGRCVLKTKTYTDTDGTPKVYKFLIFTDNLNYQRCIEVNSSIATNSYSTALPYFDNTNNIYDRSKLINLGVSTPSECIGIESIPRSSTADFEQNQLVNRMWEWRILFRNRFGEMSAYGIISDQYSPVTGAGCIAGSDGLPRCVKLTIEAGNPFVEWIEIAFRINDGDWKKYDTIRKYDNDTGVPWYERPLSADLVNYDAVTNKFEYIFCGDKQWDLLPQEETSRIENYLPKRSAAIYPLDLSLGVANNVHGFEPIPKSELEKIDIVVTDPESTCSSNPLRTVEAYIFILNWHQYQAGATLADSMGLVSSPYQPTHAPTNAEYGDPDVWWGRKIFDAPGGGLVPDSSTYWGQFFRHDTDLNASAPRNFTAFMAGTSFSAEAQQYIKDGTNECPIGIWDYLSPPAGCPDIPVGCMVQKVTFTDLPPGRYVLRLCDHKAAIDPLLEYQKTSTQVYGTTLMGNLSASTLAAPFAGFSSNDKELVIDCTAGDVKLIQPTDPCLVVLDLAWNETPGTTSPGVRRTYDGYLREDEVSEISIERQQLTMPSPVANSMFTQYTDHNGYWFGSWEVDDGDQSPTGDSAHPTRTNVNDCVNAVHDINLHGIPYLDGTGQQYSAGGFWFLLRSRVFSGSAEFPDAGRTHVVGNRLLCGDAGIGLVGFPVVVFGGASDVTDSSGHFDIIVHNWGGVYAGAAIRGITSESGGCIVSACNDSCNFDKPIFAAAFIACTGNSRTITLVDEFYSIYGVNLYGLQNGGIYQACIQGYDWLGRRTFAQTLDKFRFPIKSISETQVYAFSQIGFTIDPSMILPLEIAYLTFGFTPNLNFSSFFTWIIDQVQFVDSRGKTNNANPDYIRIYYSSLSEYNKNFDFKTNATWQLLASDEALQTTAQNDQVEIIQLGGEYNGTTWLDKRLVADVLYDSNGTFFTIKYSPEYAFLLNPLVANKSIIKLMRPKDFSDTSPFFEVCQKIPVIEGVPQILSGTLNPVDSYMYSRRIPIPKPLQAFGQYLTSGYSAATSTPLKENDVILFFNDTNPLQIDDTQFATKFEHDSPSDFWGEKVTSRGRVNVINPYEAEKRFQTENILSKPLNENTYFNGISYFAEADAVNFNQENWGGIMCVVPNLNRILFICEFDHFIVGYRESGMRAAADGSVLASQNIGNFSIPQKRPGQEYGCQPYFLNTIRAHKGVVYWLDATRQALAQCDYNVTRDVSKEDSATGVLGGYKSYLNKKIERHNLARAVAASVSKRPIFIGGINPRNSEYLLTYNEIPFGARLNEENPAYLNLSNDLVYSAANDTLIVDLKRGYLKSFASFTPEYYSNLEYRGGMMIALRLGQSWAHYIEFPTDASIYNNFFGTQAKKVVQIVYNVGVEKVKRFLWNEVYAKEHLMIADEILSETGQESRILSPYWRRGEHFTQAPFLCDLNTVFQNADQPTMAPLAIVAGELMSGRWLMVKYISQNADDSKYIEISSFIAHALGVDKSGE